jgi:nitroreductase
MNFQELVRTRRSVRRFRKGTIPETKVLSILDSARWIPSYRNSQSWNLLVVYGRDDLNFLSEIYLNAYLRLAENLIDAEKNIIMGMKETLRREFLDASFAVIMVADKSLSPSWPIDLSMASENMMLMAHELGIGSSFIDVTYSRISRYFEKDKIYKRYGIPDGMEIFSILVFGIPDEIPRVPHRKSLSEIVHYGGW